MGILQTIEADLTADGKWLVAEAETAATSAWTDVIKPLIVTVEPQALAAAGSAFDKVLGIATTLGVDIVTGAGEGKVLTAVLNVLMSEGETLAAQLAPEAMAAILALKKLALTTVQTVTGAATDPAPDDAVGAGA